MNDFESSVNELENNDKKNLKLIHLKWLLLLITNNLFLLSFLISEENIDTTPKFNGLEFLNINAHLKIPANEFTYKKVDIFDKRQRFIATATFLEQTPRLGSIDNSAQVKVAITKDNVKKIIQSKTQIFTIFPHIQSKQNHGRKKHEILF